MTDDARWLAALVRLYPPRWRRRYADEYLDLILSLADGRGRLARGRLAVNVIRGAVDAHLFWRSGMPRSTVDPAVRRGALDGLLIAGVMAVVVVLTVVVFPSGPNESDSDPEYLITLLAGYLLLAVLFVAIGARGRRRSGHPWSGALAGAAAGLVIVLSVIVIYSVVNNVFFSIVSQQHDKRIAFAASGWSSMRAWVNVQLLTGAFVVVPAAVIIGGLLGGLGGALFPPRRPTSSRAPV